MARAGASVGADGGARRHRSAGRDRHGVGADVGNRPGECVASARD
ncbi:hypothetical protein [Corynebacterium aurimucosum]|nr:hypothetical protein [Corynebacterium aurimucosum]